MEIGKENSIIRAVNISYSYDSDVKALENISFNVLRGEVVTILGPNGAGKTTLLKCLLKILKPHGAIYIDGKEIQKISNKELARKIGYVPQRHHSIFAYRVIDFVLMGRAPHHTMFSLPSKSEYEKVVEILKILGISDLAHRTIAEVSGGQLQLILIARALIQEAKILLLDEPTAHLDIANELKVLSIVRSLVKKNIVEAAIMTLHDPIMAALFSDKIILLSNGVVLAYGKPEQVLATENLYKAYGIEFDVLRRNNNILVIPKKLPEI